MSFSTRFLHFFNVSRKIFARTAINSICFQINFLLETMNWIESKTTKRPHQSNFKTCKMKHMIVICCLALSDAVKAECFVACQAVFSISIYEFVVSEPKIARNVSLDT